jgi:hypothetical protein
MRTALRAVAIIAAAIVLTAAPAHADPDPAPIPVVPTPGGGAWMPGAQVYPPVCAVQPRACNFDYSPDTGSWTPQPNN